MSRLGSELIWQGRMHLGDEPGILGDASYGGLSTELPITLKALGDANTSQTTLLVTTDNVTTVGGHPGHLLTAVLYDTEIDGTVTETELWRGRLTTSEHDLEVEVDVTGRPSAFIGVRIRVDTSVPPGLYDDFLLTRLSSKPVREGLVASFGFHR
ncbi:hypothetical protein AB0F85_13515 [Nocardia fluminea]|uniref:hypothetical protein n=1 Tax=Nocardia fluminea TaxID=134984 RepID=UPI0033C55815